MRLRWLRYPSSKWREARELHSNAVVILFDGAYHVLQHDPEPQRMGSHNTFWRDVPIVDADKAT